MKKIFLIFQNLIFQSKEITMKKILLTIKKMIIKKILIISTALLFAVMSCSEGGDGQLTGSRNIILPQARAITAGGHPTPVLFWQITL